MNSKENHSKVFGNDECKKIKEFVCPYCNEHLTINPRQYANHIRWCKCNPNYNKILKNTSEHIKETKKEFFNKKFGEYKNFIVTCSTCGKQFTIQERKNKFDPNKKYYCCQSCANTHKITQESKDKIRKIIMEKYSIIKPYEHGGKLYKFKKECPYCNNIFYTDKETQISCCKSHSKYYRDLKECLNQDKLDVYRNQCSFKFGISSYPDEFNFNLIKENGWYKAKNHGNNLSGVSRDHMYSGKEGFMNKIDPYLISHPANCQLLVHSKNVSKYDNCSITFEELKKRVDNWNIKYGEYPNKINYKLLSTMGIEITHQPSS